MFFQASGEVCLDPGDEDGRQRVVSLVRFAVPRLGVNFELQWITDVTAIHLRISVLRGMSCTTPSPRLVKLTSNPNHPPSIAEALGLAGSNLSDQDHFPRKWSEASA
jgi:hypothetical protein